MPYIRNIEQNGRLIPIVDNNVDCFRMPDELEYSTLSRRE